MILEIDTAQQSEAVASLKNREEAKA